MSSGLVLVAVPGKYATRRWQNTKGYYLNRGTTTGCVYLQGRMITSEDTLRLGTTRTAQSTSFTSKRACLVDDDASPRVSLLGLVVDVGGTAGSHSIPVV